MFFGLNRKSQGNSEHPMLVAELKQLLLLFLSFYMDLTAFYCRFLTQLCYDMFQSRSQDRGWKNRSWTSHFHLQCSAAYPYVQHRNNMNVTHHIFTIQLLMESVCRGEQSGSRHFSLHPCKRAVFTFPPSADLSSSFSPLLRLCCLDFAEAD